jgi:hypothetical protein
MVIVVHKQNGVRSHALSANANPNAADDSLAWMLFALGKPGSEVQVCGGPSRLVTCATVGGTRIAANPCRLLS